MNSGELGRSKEDYLEAILVVIREKGACRSTDIAAQVHYSKPSVSVALHKLEDDGLVVRDDWRVLLTEEDRRGKKSCGTDAGKAHVFSASVRICGCGS